MREKIKRVIANTDFIYYIFIVLVSCIITIPVLSKNIDVYYDDGIQHIARAFGTLESIKEQGINANVIQSFSNGFGYSWNLFYGPLSTISIIIINFICGNMITAYKLLNFISLILSGFFMYKFMLSITKNSNTSLLASIIYITFPYRLTDWYSRNALGEVMSFMFVPLVFLGLYQLFNTTENHYYLTFGAVRTYFNTQYKHSYNLYFWNVICFYKF